MKQVIEIRPIGLMSTEIRFEYEIKKTGNWVALTRGYQHRSSKSTSSDNPSEKTLIHKFTVESQIFRFEWDDSDERLNNAAKIIMNHPHVEHDLNENFTKAVFKLEHKTQNNINQAYSIKQKGVIFNRVNNTTIGRMKDIAYAVGLNPTGMSHVEVFNKLIDFNTGVLMIGNLEKSISLIESDSNQELVVMKKAIILGIITNREGMFYIKENPIGDNEDKVLSYLKENKGIYDSYVRKEVAQQDKITPEEMEEKVFDILKQKPIDTGTKTKNHSMNQQLEWGKLKDRAKFYKIANYWNMGYDAIKEAVEKVETSVPKLKEEYESQIENV